MTGSKKTAIVTGASTGIGFATVKAFLDAGYGVVMNSRDPDNLKSAHARLGDPINAVLVAGDVSDKSVGEELSRAAVAAFGGIDVLVNNAGVFNPKPFLETREEDLDRFFKINFKGTYFTTQSIIPELKKRGGGSVINVGTTLIDHAIGGFPASAALASKAAVHSLAAQLAAEFGKDGIRVTTIAPGIIDTPLHAKNGIDDVSQMAGLHLLNRIGAAQDVANAIVMLAENTFISGEKLLIDGGHAAGHHLA